MSQGVGPGPLRPVVNTQIRSNHPRRPTHLASPFPHKGCGGAELGSKKLRPPPTQVIVTQRRLPRRLHRRVVTAVSLGRFLRGHFQPSFAVAECRVFEARHGRALRSRQRRS